MIATITSGRTNYRLRSGTVLKRLLQYWPLWKSDLFEALETLRAWYLEDQERKRKTEKRQAEQEEEQIIAEALGD
jgi:hypothetical protein